ncbi:hypothetical protein GCM10010449_45090 [Streptomyces rectiviolaceus]|uniref:Small integral membrane protein n=1 Tax=Streptomyces rectiviolaceus TaxID=332591 RepID=A0ABP6MKV3_9ACTN
MVSTALGGLIAGMALGFAGWFGGFGAFLLVAALGAVGFVVGRLVDEGTDIRAFLGGRDQERR